MILILHLLFWTLYSIVYLILNNASLAHAISSSVPDSLIFWSWIFHLFRSPFDDDSFTLSFCIFHLILTLSSFYPGSSIFWSWLFHLSILTHPSSDPDSYNFLSWLFQLLIMNLSPSLFIFWCCLFFIFSSWLFYFILTLHASTVSCIIHLLILTLSSLHPDSFIYGPDADSFTFSSWLFHLLILTLSFSHSDSFTTSWLFMLLSMDHSPFLILTLSSFYPDSFTVSTVLMRTLSLLILTLSPSHSDSFTSSWHFMLLAMDHSPFLILTLSSYFPDSFTVSTVWSWVFHILTLTLH